MNTTVLDFLKSKKATDIRPYWYRCETGRYSISYLVPNVEERQYIYSGGSLTDDLQPRQIIDINLFVYVKPETGAVFAYKDRPSMTLDELIAAQ